MALIGSIPVRFEDAFPSGAYAVGVDKVRDFDASRASGGDVQARDKNTGELLWVVDVIDPDPQARDKSVRVKVTGAVQPVLPEAAAGVPFRPVEFDNLSVTPYVNDKGRLAYSFRARGVRGPAKASAPTQAKAAA